MRIWRKASEQDRASGIEWYDRARRLAEELDPESPERAAGVIAALSPQTSWPQNVTKARAMYAGVEVGGLGDGIRKAARILAGETPEDVLRGPKVRTFYFTIVNPFDPRTVVVDRHAVDIALGRVTDDATRGRILGVKGGYEEICEMYRRAAKIASKEMGRPITPAQVQAVTWTHWRREHAVANHGDHLVAA